MVPVALSLGSSLGDRLGRLRMAVAVLRAQAGLSALRCSSVAWTPAVGGVARAPFLNAVIVAECSLEPLELLHLCKSLEQRLGRQPTRRFAERCIDLDILLYGKEILELPGLQLPHPRLLERPFFLELLQEVWPDARDPRTGLPLMAPRRWPRIGRLE